MDKIATIRNSPIRRRMLGLVVTITAASIVIGSGALYFLFRSALDSEKHRLSDIVHSQARLIGAVARFDARYSQHDHPAGAAAATLSQVEEAFANYDGFGETGGLLLARRRDGNIEFLVFSQRGVSRRPGPVPWASPLAEPARRALKGETGTLVGLDYRGARVIAAYEPLSALNSAIVAKIDFAEVIAPFYRTALLSAGALVSILLLGIALYRRIARHTRELEQTGTALRQSEARLANAQRIAGMGNWDWDIVGGGLHWSDEIYRIFGLTPNRFGASYEAFLAAVHPEDRAMVEDAVAAALAQAAPYSIEHRIVLPDGEVRVVQEIGEVTFADGGRPIRMTGTVLDITERAHAAEKIRDLNERLERRVEERTAALNQAQAELVKQERLATLGQLAATVSHELRNPLGTIGTSLAVVDAKVRDRDLGVENALARMRRSVSRCDAIIGEMLDYARDRDLLAVRTNLDSWVGELLDELDVPPGVEIRRRLDAGDAEVRIDREILRRAIINLYANACDALAERKGGDLPPATGCIAVETRQSGGWAEITLADNGLGMPEDVLGKAFEPLFSTKGFGVGLGLPIVKKIVEQHDGSVAIASEPGGGTRASLRIPLEPVEAAVRRAS